MFTVIEAGYVILTSKGVWKQVKIYERKGRLYAAYGSGFIALSTRNATSLPKMRWDEIEAPDMTIHKSSLGYLVNKATFTGDSVKL